MRRGGGAGARLMRRGIETFMEGVQRLAREGGARAPARGSAALAARAWSEDLLAGYAQDPSTLLTPLRVSATEDLVALRDLEFSSVCRHHLLPFTGRVHLAYAPHRSITGLSRLARLVDCLSRRLQLQETLTREIADHLQRQLRPAGAACVIEATHACMSMRGARRQARVVTTAFTGTFRANSSLRREVTAVLMGAPPARARGRRRRLTPRS